MLNANQGGRVTSCGLFHYNTETVKAGILQGLETFY